MVAQGDIGIGLCLWKYLLQMNFHIKREMPGKSLKPNDNKSKHAMFLLRVLYCEQKAFHNQYTPERHSFLKLEMLMSLKQFILPVHLTPHAI